jgi:hypothetical protein
MPIQETPEQGLLDPTTSIFELEDKALGIAYGFSSLFTYSIEVLLLYRHGTMYFEPIVIFLAPMILFFLGALISAASGMMRLVPFTHIPVPLGLYDLVSFSELVWIVSLVHGIRKWRLMLNPASEVYSRSAGPLLFFFRYLPKGESYWFCRIVWEPTLIFVLAVVLRRLLIIQSSLETYLQIAAFFCAMKQYIVWYTTWKKMRKILDAKYLGPLIARATENNASKEEMAQAHMAVLPPDIPGPVRRQTYVASAVRIEEFK